jgi:hypothetical protein
MLSPADLSQVIAGRLRTAPVKPATGRTASSHLVSLNIGRSIIIPTEPTEYKVPSNEYVEDNIEHTNPQKITVMSQLADVNCRYRKICVALHARISVNEKNID